MSDDEKVLHLPGAPEATTPDPEPVRPEQVPMEYSLRGGKLHRYDKPLACPFLQPFIVPSRIAGRAPDVKRVPCGTDCALFQFEVVPGERLGMTGDGAKRPVSVVILNCGSGRTIVVDPQFDSNDNQPN